jgi:ribosomal protein S18 acetylase RimI-like enzyme
LTRINSGTEAHKVSRKATVLPGQETLVASWNALAQLSPGARVIRSAAAIAAVFPSWEPLNNAIMLGAPDSTAAAATTSQLASTYTEAGVDTWAFWVPSCTTDLDAPDDVREVGGLKRDTTTLVMRATLQPGLRRHDGVARASIAAAPRAAGDEPVPITDLEEPDGAPGLTGWVMIQGDAAVAGAWSFLHKGDCGIYTIGTLPEWRRRGLARALTEHVLADAHHRGARTATLQSTRMGLPLYESLGFEPVGRYEEWVSRAAANSPA